MNSMMRRERGSIVSLADFLEGVPPVTTAGPRRGLRFRTGKFFASTRAWTVLLPIADYGVLVLALAGLAFLRLHEPMEEFFAWEKFLSTNTYIAAIIATIFVGNGYRPKNYVRRLGFAAEFVLSVLVGSAIGLFIIYALFPGSLRISQESRAVLLLGSGVFLIQGIVGRVLLSRYRSSVGESRPFLVIGSRDDNHRFSENFLRTGLPNPLIFIDPSNSDDFANGTPPPDFVRHSFEGIILAGTLMDLPSRLQEWLLEVHSENLPVYTLRCFYASMWRQSPVLDGKPDWIFEQDFRLAERSYYRAIKRFFDLAVSTIVGLVALPFLIVIAIAIKLDSRGPVLFVQERVGRRQKVFRLYKFRTMHVRAEEGPHYTARNDPRVTRIGRILRRLRFDELPQLLNILKGDMSLIGPRPESKKLVDTYEHEIPGYHLRHLVSPGITGWAQLNHPYGEGVDDTIEKLKFDLYYIQFYSPVLDLEIILKTIVSMALLRGR